MTTLDQPTPDATPSTHLGSARDFFAALDFDAPPYNPELHDDDCEDVTCARCIDPTPTTTQ